ncbi:serpin B11-like [Symsagittifera roscoffensis]|uniref:serpin B11-like n=1 Tax=Symsagittifera roscoffensis TaxID=84072 RepID=UPI00307CB064
MSDKKRPKSADPGKSQRSHRSKRPHSARPASGMSGGNDTSVNTNFSKTPDFNKPKCNVAGFSKTSDYESWLHPSLHKFCHEIVAKLYKTNANRNFLMSPVTAYITVGMLSCGAKGKTMEEICELLCVKDNIQKSVKESATILEHITTDKEFRVHNTDGVFVHTKYPVIPEFKRTIEKKFKAEAHHANFDSRTEAAETMNTWLKRATRGRIREIVHETQSDSLLYVCNTVYMKSQWEMEFPKKMTKQGTFNASGKTVSVMYMNKADTFEYVDNSKHGFEVIFLPYEGQIERDRWQMAIFLPNSRINMAQLSHFIKSKHLRRLKKKVKHTDLDVKLPKFKMTTTIDLMPLMKHYGLRNAFDSKTRKLQI